MVKISGNSSGTICGGMPEDVGLEKTYVKQANAGNEIQYLAFIALKNITVGREHPPEPKEPPTEPKPPRDWCNPPIWPPKEPKPREPEPPCRSCYSSPPPRDDPWDRKKPWEK